jgi:hypothetical protein
MSSKRYEREFLLFLQKSPLCVKPEKLPSREELEKWMELVDTISIPMNETD